MRKSDIDNTISGHLVRIEKEEYQNAKSHFVDLASKEYDSTSIPQFDEKLKELLDASTQLRGQIAELEARMRAINNEHNKVKWARREVLNDKFGMPFDWYSREMVIDSLSEKLAKSKNAVFQLKTPGVRNQIKEAIVLARTTQGLALLVDTVLEVNDIQDSGLKSYVTLLSTST